MQLLIWYETCLWLDEHLGPNHIWVWTRPGLGNGPREHLTMHPGMEIHFRALLDEHKN